MPAIHVLATIAFLQQCLLEPSGITISAMIIWMNLGYSQHENYSELNIIVAFELQFNTTKLMWRCLAYWSFSRNKLSIAMNE